MVKSDIDQLLATARNGSTAGCKVTGVLDSLDPVTADKVRAALLERKPGNPRQWAYVDTKLVDVLLQLASTSGVTRSSVVTFRKTHSG